MNSYTTLPPVDDADRARQELNGRGSLPPVECEICCCESGDGGCRDCLDELAFDLAHIKEYGICAYLGWVLSYLDDEPETQADIDRADNRILYGCGGYEGMAGDLY